MKNKKGIKNDNKIVEGKGFSNLGLNDAFQNALLKFTEHEKIEIIETQSSWVGDEPRYKVTVAAFVN